MKAMRSRWALVHVGLDLKDKGPEKSSLKLSMTWFPALRGRGGWSYAGSFQEGLHAEVGEGGAEEHGESLPWRTASMSNSAPAPSSSSTSSASRSRFSWPMSSPGRIVQLHLGGGGGLWRWCWR